MLSYPRCILLCVCLPVTQSEQINSKTAFYKKVFWMADSLIPFQRVARVNKNDLCTGNILFYIGLIGFRILGDDRPGIVVDGDDYRCFQECGSFGSIVGIHGEVAADWQQSVFKRIQIL